jgi:hypothetical protein
MAGTIALVKKLTTTEDGDMRLDLFAVLLPLALGGSEPEVRNRFADLPAGWRVEQDTQAPALQAAEIGKKLGGEVVGLTNTVLSVDGQRLQVNQISCRTAADAERIYRTLRKSKGHPALALRRETTVIEFVVGDVRLAVRGNYVLRYRPATARYHVRFAAAPLVQCDYMRWNGVFNAFMKLEQAAAADRPAAEAAALNLVQGFQFGDTLWLRRHGQGPVETQWSLNPSGEAGASMDGSRHFTFATIPKRAGVPYVLVAADVTSEAFAQTPAEPSRSSDLTAATDLWPVDDPEIRKLVAEITANKVARREQVQAILEWLLPGRNVRYAGDVIGSRYGAAAVLKQGYGHCWDFSDLFITLCRAAGIPARQVGGWLFEQDGHVWAEVLCDETGWEAVDPTAGMGCGSDYIPLLSTTDGRWPWVYVSGVRIDEMPVP